MSTSDAFFMSDPVTTVDGILKSAGFRRIRLDGEGAPRDEGLVAVYEDAQSFVGVAYFSTFSSLVDGWLQAQEDVAGLTVNSVSGLGAKAWDGYLVLLTMQTISDREVAAVTAIRGNTRRLRKLVIAPDEGVVSDPGSFGRSLRQNLSPLLPISLPLEAVHQDPVKALPRRLRVTGLAEADVQIVLAAYEAGSPMMLALHSYRLSPGGKT